MADFVVGMITGVVLAIVVRGLIALWRESV